MAFLTIFLMSGGFMMKAQELFMPEKWKESLYTIKPIFKPDTLTIRILGDMMMHEKQISHALTPEGEYDFSSYFTFIADAVREADIAIANMEFTLAGEPYSGYPCFSAPDSYARHLAESGFDIFLAANNHIFDKGTEGAERTIRIYRKLHDEYGIRFTGIAGDMEELTENNPLMIREKGMKLAILNFTYGTNLGLDSAWPKTNYIGERAKTAAAFSIAAEKEADLIMAFPHWGTEYALQHSERQEEEARMIVEKGAGLIIGSHPHVVQDTVAMKEVPVLYSLGNAVSNMSAANTQLGLMATVRAVREGNGDIRLLPLEIKFLWCSRPGGYNDSYTILPVTDFMGRQDEWKNVADYNKMVATYKRVKKETGIND